MPDDSLSKDEGDYFMVRPGTYQFLTDLACLWEIVIFTAAMPDYADWIVDQIDVAPGCAVRYRLYR